MRLIGFALVPSLCLTVLACSHYAPMSEARMERDRRGDLLIDISLRHDLGFTERYVATYTVGRRVGHLVSSERRETHSVLPLEKIDELHALATNLLEADPAQGRTCNDCTGYIVVVRVGTNVQTLSGWMTSDAKLIRQTLRALGV